ncbi:MAG: 16S rRNA (cytidine(1402)-2'-O)-methyltransferase [Patescibacteria group bacterium]
MSKLYIVGTPIGNLKDITLRALEILKSADLIACEDTRVSKKLLDHYEIKTKLVSYHQHSNEKKVSFLLQELASGKEIALITDAGTPGISDPGNLLVKEIGEKHEVIAIPGPSALTAALSISGLPTDKFFFLGFLPHKKGRETLFKRIEESEETVVFYESTHRIMKTLERIKEWKRNIVVCRELTKKFETVYRGKPKDILEKISKENRGEFVVIIPKK